MPPARETSVEITAEDAAAIAELSSTASTTAPPTGSGRSGGHHSNSVAKRFTKLIKPMSKNLQHLRPSPRHHHNNNKQQQQQMSSNDSDHATAGDFSIQHHQQHHHQQIRRPFSSSLDHNRGHDQDNSSFNSESIGQMSVTPTVASLDTVKISNLNQQQQQQLLQEVNKKSNKKTPWKKLKHFMGVVASSSSGGGGKAAAHHGSGVAAASPFTSVLINSMTAAQPALRRSHSKSVDFPTNNHMNHNNNNDAIPFNRRRVASMDFPKAFSSKKKSPTKSGGEINPLQQQSMLDDAVRGRLDGLDVLSLGPAYLISLPRQTNNSESSSSSSTPWEPTPAHSFAGRLTQYSTKQIVMDMMRRSAGQELPEIVLEGYFRDDRWIVTLDSSPQHRHGTSSMMGNSTTTTTGARRGNSSSSGDFLLDLIEDPDGGRHSPEPLPPLQLTDEEDHSHSTGPPPAEDIPRHKLWNSMWGQDQKPPPKPSLMSSVEDLETSENILEVAASCSVPIDIDEDTFMIGNPQHLQAVHEIASAPLQHGRFEEAYKIFERILRGILIQENNDAVRHLEGVTLHNMAVVLMWQNKFTQALECIGKAILARHQYLPKNHPDLAVSLVAQGYAYFALEKFDLAIASFEAALDIFQEDNVARAKILNNLGVANYQCGDDTNALKNFSDALEIQRIWCQGPVRRDAHVFGAAVMLGNMGKIHIKRGDYDLALSVYEEALVLQTSMFPKDHDVVLASLTSVALVWAFNSKPQKSGQILNGVLRSLLSRFGPGTIEVVEVTGTIGNLHFGLGNFEDALKCFAPVLKWQKANLSPDHPSLKRTKDSMKKIKNSIQAVWV